MENRFYYSSSSILTSDSILIVNPAQCREKLHSIISGSVANLQILADFDFTLSKYTHFGTKLTTTYELLKYVRCNQMVLTNDQWREAEEIFQYYHSKETDPTVPQHEKSQLMEEWRNRSNAQILETRFKKEVLNSDYSEKLMLRDGVDKILSLCKEHRIPITVLSAGIGNIIETTLRHVEDFDGLEVLANFIEFDDQNIANRFIEPQIDSQCKHIRLRGKEVKQNLILLGDQTSVRYM